MSVIFALLTVFDGEDTKGSDGCSFGGLNNNNYYLDYNQSRIQTAFSTKFLLQTN